MLSLFIHQLFRMLSKSTTAVASRKFVESDEFDGNRELSSAIYPYASNMMMILAIGRPLLILASTWRP